MNIFTTCMYCNSEIENARFEHFCSLRCKHNYDKMPEDTRDAILRFRQRKINELYYKLINRLDIYLDIQIDKVLKNL